MGGGKQRKETMERQSALSKQQEDLGKYFMEQSKEGLAQRKQLQAPVIDYYTKLASGDPTQIMTASAVPLGNLAKMTQQAKANIMEMAPGAARTAALGQLGREAGGQQSTLLNQAYLSAFPALQGLASESGNTGLQTAGAGYRGVEGAVSSNKDIMQIQQQQKASQLGLIGSLAGAAGSAVGGFIKPPTGGGGGFSKFFSSIGNMFSRRPSNVTSTPGPGVNIPGEYDMADYDPGSSFMPANAMAAYRAGQYAPLISNLPMNYTAPRLPTTVYGGFGR